MLELYKVDEAQSAKRFRFFSLNHSFPPDLTNNLGSQDGPTMVPVRLSKYDDV